MRADYVRLRAQHSARDNHRDLLTLEAARGNAPRFDWDAYDPPMPEFLGLRVFETDPGSARGPRAGFGVSPRQSSRKLRDCQDVITNPREARVTRISLATLVEYIDWSPFFHTWE